MSGGGSTPQQDATVSLLRSGSGPYLQTSTVFYLTAFYTGPSGNLQAGVAITGAWEGWGHCSPGACQAQCVGEAWVGIEGGVQGF